MHQLPVFLGHKTFGRLTCGFTYNPVTQLLMLDFRKSGIVFSKVDIVGVLEPNANKFYQAFDETDARDIINYEISCL